MRRVATLALLAALAGPQALPLVAVPLVAEPGAEHHHPEGCPWQGTPHCPHAHHGPSSEPAWSPCAEVPVAVAGEARMAWAPPSAVGDPLRVRLRPNPTPAAGAPCVPEGPVLDVEIPPPQEPVP